jgi:hypothetical protein
MKYIFMFWCIIITHPYILSGQDMGTKQGGKIGISFSSFGSNDVVRLQELDGAASYEGDYFYTAGVHYIWAVNRWLDAETGIEISKHQITGVPNVPHQLPVIPTPARFAVLQIPVTLQARFLKYFFINGGLFLEWDGGKNKDFDSQTGIGTMMGFGMKYEFISGFAIFVNPYGKIHSLIPFKDRNNHQRIVESGLRLGVTFHIP